jgi:DNA polymerase-3 subunit epsilon
VGQYDWLASETDKLIFTAFDTETTGLDPRTCRVVELGGVRFDALGVTSRFNALINPGTPMPVEASRVNGITDAMLAGKPDMREVLPDFLAFARGTVLVAHNAPFDVSFVNEELSRMGKGPLDHRVVDTRILAREAFPGLPKYALQDLASRLGIEAKDAHRAEDDARVCMELFLRCVAALRERLGVPAAPAGRAVTTTAESNAGELAVSIATNASEADEFEEPDLFADGLSDDGAELE